LVPFLSFFLLFSVDQPDDEDIGVVGLHSYFEWTGFRGGSLPDGRGSVGGRAVCGMSRLCVSEPRL
jgi:hypothetical protein